MKYIFTKMRNNLCTLIFYLTCIVIAHYNCANVLVVVDAFQGIFVNKQPQPKVVNVATSSYYAEWRKKSNQPCALRTHTRSSIGSTSSSENDMTTTSRILPSSFNATRINYRARDLVRTLIETEQCYTTERGAKVFGSYCSPDCIYEDRFVSKPFIGPEQIMNHLTTRVQQRQQQQGLFKFFGNDDTNTIGYRIDKISDGDRACGYAWTWTTSGGKSSMEGLRGTTFVELNDDNLIVYVSEFSEPLYKPGDATLELLKAVTKNEVRTVPQPYEKKIPLIANELVKYLFIDLQKADRTNKTELMTFFDENIVYRDFNYEEVFRGKEQVEKFVTDFDFPGIIFNPLKFDDGIDQTCFTWEVILGTNTNTIKGISFYELDPMTRKIMYVRDIPESALKPPPLGQLARFIQPALGVFKGVPMNSRPGGM